MTSPKTSTQRRLGFIILLVVLLLVALVPAYPRQRLLAEWEAYQYFDKLSTQQLFV